MISKKKIYTGLWLVGALIILVLTGFAIHHKKNSLCSNLKIEIANKNIGSFITEKEIFTQIENTGINILEQTVKQVNTNLIEKIIKTNPWVKNADVYFDNENNLQVLITQRNPIAKLYNLYNSSHYIDATGYRMPVKPGAAARVLIVSGFTSENDVLAKVDSNLLNDITTLTKEIIKDSFLNAQIPQININNTGKFELISNLGNHIVLFGDIKNCDEKLTRLKLFYKQAWLKNGINTYEQIDVRFKNQVVCTKKGFLNKSFLQADSSNVIANSDSLVNVADSASMFY